VKRNYDYNQPVRPITFNRIGNRSYRGFDVRSRERRFPNPRSEATLLRTDGESQRGDVRSALR
jgi:hypothetical protein